MPLFTEVERQGQNITEAEEELGGQARGAPLGRAHGGRQAIEACAEIDDQEIGNCCNALRCPGA
jgi:hypothetical protein